MQVTFSPRAQIDIKDTWKYSVEHFGLNRTEEYMRNIENGIKNIASGTIQGRACDEIRAGYFKLPVGSHVLFFRHIETTIDIVRILHKRMDVEQHIV